MITREKEFILPSRIFISVKPLFLKTIKMNKIITIIIISILFSSCNNEPKVSIDNVRQKTIVEKIAISPNNIKNVYLYTINNHQYLGNLEDFRSEFLVHNPDCIFCNKTLKQ